MLPVVQITRAAHSLSAPETTRVAFDSPRRRLTSAAFLGSPFLLLLAVNFKAVTTAFRYVAELFSKVFSKPRQDFQSSDVPAINRQLKSAGLTELHLEAALPASSQANGNNEQGHWC